MKRTNELTIFLTDKEMEVLKDTLDYLDTTEIEDVIMWAVMYARMSDNKENLEH